MMVVQKLILTFCVLLLSLSLVAQEDSAEQLPAWDGEERFMLLVMGMDRRPSERSTLQVRTDAILLISIDAVNARIGILHIPRDLHFTTLDSDNWTRVNALMQTGERLQEGYGPYYVMDTLQYNLGLYIDRYVLFDFQAFITLIDAMGGIPLTTTYTINDPTYPSMNYGYDPFYLPAGEHLLDGYDALRYARTRHGDNDFLRGVRQMQVIEAVYERMSADGMLANLLSQAPRLLDSLSGNLYTDLTMDDMVQIGQYALDTPAENIITGGINEAHIMLYPVERGRNGYVPDRSTLIELLIRVFGADYAG